MPQSESVSTESLSVELIDSESERHQLTEYVQPQETREPRTVSVRLLHTPKTVGELLRLEGYYRTLVKSFVFIQNTKESSDKLVDTMTSIIGEIGDFRFFQTHTVGIDSISEEIEKSEGALGKPQVLIVEVTRAEEDINRFCERIAAIGQRQHGIWIQGHIRYLDPRIISLFDALFTFDMSTDEYEILRTAISLPPTVIEEMRHPSDGIRRDRVLFFLNHRRSNEGPLLEKNPVVLSQIEEVPVDITLFVPIIVEATKFLFNEASQWLAVVRKRAPSENSISETRSGEDQLVVLDKQQFSSLEGDLEALRGMLDRVAVESSAYRIRGLVEQIQIHYKNLTDLEKTESEFGALAPQHIKRAIERESEAMVNKIQELQDSLSAVYQKKVQI